MALAAGGQSCSGRVLCQEGTGWVRRQRSCTKASLDSSMGGCPKHTKTTVFSPTHMKATVRGWGAGRAEEEAATAPSTRAQSLREASKATEPGARRGNSVSVVLSPRGKCCFPSRFTTNLLKQQLSLLIRCNYQLCDPESSLSEIFLHSSSSYSLFSIFSMASNRLSNSNSQAKSSSKKVMVANK